LVNDGVTAKELDEVGDHVFGVFDDLFVSVIRRDIERVAAEVEQLLDLLFCHVLEAYGLDVH
jgi:hypothetical protein